MRCLELGRWIGILAAALAAAASASAQTTVNFATATWNHSVVGGPSSSSGWAVRAVSDPGGNQSGWSLGRTSAGGVTVTVVNLQTGNADATDNFRIVGSDFQFGSMSDGYNSSTMTNYNVIAFSFNKPIIDFDITIDDIDISNEAIAAESFFSETAGAIGEGQNLTRTFQSPTYLTTASVSGVTQVYASNGTELSDDPRQRVRFQSGTRPIKSVIFYFCSRSSSSVGAHRINVRNGTFTFTPDTSNMGWEVDWKYPLGATTSVNSVNFSSPTLESRELEFDYPSTSSTYGWTLMGPYDNFALHATGYITLPSSGTWQFRVYSDDGSRLWVNNTEVVTNDGQHGYTSVSGSISLSAGTYPIALKYFEQGGAQGLRLEWRAPAAGSFSLVPREAVTQSSPRVLSIEATAPSN